MKGRDIKMGRNQNEVGNDEVGNSDAEGGNVQVEAEAEHDQEVLTVDEVAKLLRINRKTLYAAIKLNQIPGVRRIGGTIRLHKRTVLTWLAAGQGRVSSRGMR